MKVALVNPPWSFEGSIYFGCREPHLPLEYGYAQASLEAAGHEARIVDAHLGVSWAGAEDGDVTHRADGRGEGFDDDAVRRQLEEFRPDMTVLTTAPSYLFWRCAPPELRVPMRTLRAIRDVAGAVVVVGPHASTTPGATLDKLGADAVVLGECEDVIAELASTPTSEWHAMPAVAVAGRPKKDGGKHAAPLERLPALRWPREVLERHRHHHHRFDRTPDAPGGELEASRGCPYHCTFCAKDNFRDAFRKRPLDVVMTELDAMIERGVRYVYFVDEIFVPNVPLLRALEARNVQFGVQMRIDNWTPEALELLGRAGCVSIEGGMESITERGRSLLQKRCKLSTDELTELFIVAKKHVPFVQANLIEATDPKDAVAAWREKLKAHGVWANEPVPLFPYPGSPEYTLRFGVCDDRAWERAHEHYLSEFGAFSDIQEDRPIPLPELERRSTPTSSRS